MADKYIIKVTAGSGYDLKDHVEVPVNSADPIKVSNEFLDVELNVRVRNYHGLPRNSPETSPYFETEPHAYNKDQYSIAFRFTPKKPGSSEAKDRKAGDAAIKGDETEQKPDGISAADLQFGNDFDHPIRDRLPPGFGTAMNIVRWWIDPGLEGDAYADMPYLYGPALSSFNAVHVGPAEQDPDRGGLWVEEGGDEAGVEARRAVGAPNDAKQRMKWALRAENKEKWVWEYGKTYAVDFYNPYINFSDFSLQLPGFSVPIMKYWDGQGLRKPQPKRSHQLRYVLRNRSTSDIYLVVLFTLYLKEDVNEDGSLKPAAIEATARKSGGVAAGKPIDPSHTEEPFDEQKTLEEAKRKLSGVDQDEVD